MRPKRIALYGNFGDGNLGNECTLQTVIARTLKRWPDAQLTCICTGPKDVRSRHRIAAFSSRAMGESRSWRAPSADSAAGASEAAAGSKPRPAIRRASAARRVLRGLKSLCKFPFEVAHWVRSLRVMAGTDMLIVPGTGIVTDSRCGPWIWPYELFKYCILAALCRVELVFLSVGAGPIHHRLSRWFIAKSLALASYRSYRDEDSKRCVEGLGLDARRDAVYPDLVFGLPIQNPLPAGGAGAGERVIGLGLKDYSGSEGAADGSAYQEYLESMATFVSWLGGRGYTVRLLIGDVQYDNRVRRDLLELLAVRSPGVKAPRVQPVPTVEELIRQLKETEAVISPRLHNLILALMLEKPVIALCDLPKVKSLLHEMQLAEYCLPMEKLDIGSLTSRFLQLEGEASRLKSHIRACVDAHRHAVERQYAAVFDDTGMLSPAGAGG